MVAIAVGGFMYPVTYLPQYNQMVDYHITPLQLSTSTSLSASGTLLILEEATECTYTKEMNIVAGHMLVLSETVDGKTLLIAVVPLTCATYMTLFLQTHFPC